MKPLIVLFLLPPSVLSKFQIRTVNDRYMFWFVFEILRVLFKSVLSSFSSLSLL